MILILIVAKSLSLLQFGLCPLSSIKYIISFKSASLQSASANSKRFTVKAEQAKHPSLTCSALMRLGC